MTEKHTYAVDKANTALVALQNAVKVLNEIPVEEDEEGYERTDLIPENIRYVQQRIRETIEHLPDIFHNCSHASNDEEYCDYK